MCIAIGKPKGLHIDKDTLLNCWIANPDGCGYAYADKNFNVIIKKFMTFNEFYDSYKIDDELYGDKSDMLIHFRITSRGATKIENCHPFQINNKMAFIHNGTISAMPIDTKHHYSDTFIFNELVLKKLPKNWEDSEGTKLLIEEMIKYSKIVMLHTIKGLYFFNEQAGKWHEGIWYSNSSYEPRKYKQYDFSYSRGQSYRDQVNTNTTVTVINSNKNIHNVKSSVYIQCDHCGEYVESTEMIPCKDMLNPNESELVCQSCIETWTNMGYEISTINFTNDVERIAYVNNFKKTAKA